MTSALSKTVFRIRQRQVVMAQLGRLGKKQARLPVQHQPDNVRVAYFKELRALMFDAKSFVDAMLLPQLASILAESKAVRGDSAERLDAGPGRRVQAIMAGITNTFFRGHPTEELTALAEKYAAATSKHQKEQLGRQLKAAVGVDVLGSEPALKPILEDFAVHNSSLIVTVPRAYFADIESRTMNALRTGTRAEDLEDELVERYGVAENRAKLIARDQIGKLNGELNQARQTELGVNRFIWRSMEDNRVRPEHVRLEGKSFDWDTGDPIEGIPGYPINCRCFAEPDLSELLAPDEE